MRSRSVFITSSVILLLALFARPANAQDYSAYNIANNYLGKKNYLLAYKYLIIFEYSNYDRLQKKENAAALNNLESKISDLEEYLSSNVGWYVIKQSRGWTDQQVKDSTQNKANSIRLQKINMQ